jgi:hypothetical protein
MLGAHFRPEWNLRRTPTSLFHGKYPVGAEATPSTRGRSPCEATGGRSKTGRRSGGSAGCSEGVVLSAEAFEIIVKGRLTPTLVAALEGFEVSRYDHNLTYLVGWVPDQTRLHFVLSVLRDLNVELKSVNAVKSADPVLEGPGTTT